MDTLETKCASLRAQIAATEAQLAGLKRELDLAERAATATITASETKTESKTCNGTASHSGSGVDTDADTDTATGTAEDRTWPMLDEEYRRYGRQMIVEQIGLEGQLKLRSTRVLIVGAGGLGCPAAMYLAAAGVGTLGMVDGDTVEVSNLHRQVLHRARNVGRFKVDSAIEYLRELNPHPTYIPHREHLSPQEAAKIFANYDLILDCTDNPATRYLISDTAVLLGKPLVSASALRTEGQLMVLNNPPRPAGDQTGGPCYRCVFPKPPPATSVVTCADGGIIGPVVGTMGVLQALEAIKVITGDAPSPPALQIFSAFSSPLFRTIKLRSRRANCAVCSAEASVTLDTVASGSTDYIFFCGITDPGILLSPEERISALEYQKTAPTSTKHTLIDVREKVQFDICSLDNSVNVPISTILSASRNHNNNNNNNNDPNPSGQRPLPPWLPADIVSAESTDPIYVVCRLGNDSQLAVQKLKELGLDRGGERFVGDIQGGLRAWRRDVDHEWPEY